MRGIYSAAAIAAVFGVCAAASAQSGQSELYPHGFTLRGGVAVPLDRTLTNVASSLANIGIEFTMPTPLLSNGESYVALDYMWRGFGGGGNKGTVVPLTINHRVYSSDSALRSYYFFGVGASFINISGNGTALTARFGVGQELGPNTIAEITALLSDRAGGARANAITFNIGYRF